ncbi:hypothetical protein HMPREF0969_00766 [Bacteroides sp. D20]|jgi:hypothetical protein|nr:hypothetical protein HMPREF0969_00766 [Bacteroides sp. D20]
MHSAKLLQTVCSDTANYFAVALQQFCSDAASALQWRCNGFAVALQKACSIFAVTLH